MMTTWLILAGAYLWVLIWTVAFCRSAGRPVPSPPSREGRAVREVLDLVGDEVSAVVFSGRRSGDDGRAA